MRNPPSVLKRNIRESTISSEQGEIEGPSYFGTNTARQSINYYMFDLVGVVKKSYVIIDPPYYVFPSPLLINKQYTREFTVRNPTECPITISIEPSKAISTPNVSHQIDKVSALIQPNSETNIKLVFSSNKIGKNQKVGYVIHVQNGDLYSVEMVGHFVGP